MLLGFFVNQQHDCVKRRHFTAFKGLEMTDFNSFGDGLKAGRRFGQLCLDAQTELHRLGLDA